MNGARRGELAHEWRNQTLVVHAELRRLALQISSHKGELERLRELLDVALIGWFWSDYVTVRKMYCPHVRFVNPERCVADTYNDLERCSAGYLYRHRRTLVSCKVYGKMLPVMRLFIVPRSRIADGVHETLYQHFRRHAAGSKK